MPRALHPQTLQSPITVEGRGLHGNQACRVTLRPVERPTGIRFRHLPTAVEVPARADRVGDLSLATTLVQDGVRFGTIEHLLSALMGLEVEHVLIETDGEELPILDGSARPWVEAIQRAGIASLPGRRRFIKVLRTVVVEAKGKWMRVSPYDGLRLRYTIDFPLKSIGRQSREWTLDPAKYLRELASARTFCMEQDIAAMQAVGLARGGSLENAVVYGAQGPLNETLRYEDEAVRHKMLDLVGDLALLGAPLLGLVEAEAAGHALHVALVKALLADPTAWRWVEAGSERHPRPVLTGFPEARPLPV